MHDDANPDVADSLPLPDSDSPDGTAESSAAHRQAPEGTQYSAPIGPIPLDDSPWYRPTTMRPDWRIWPTLVIMAGIIPAMIIGSSIVLGAILTVSGRSNLVDNQAAFELWFDQFVTTPGGMVAALLPIQVVILTAALVPAWLSPTPMAKRLGLGRARLSIWGIIVIVIATPVIGTLVQYIYTFIWSQFTDAPLPESEGVEALTETIAQSQGIGLATIIGIIVLVAGVAEELLFRGYMQTRLLKRWHPAAAIALTSVVFAAMHFDPIHVVGVLPTGIWLGIVAWRAGAVWPAMAAHAFNNLAFVVLGRAYHEQIEGGLGDQSDSIWTLVAALVTFVVSLAALVGALIVLVKGSSRQPPTDVAQ